jgi:uncharacterized protein (DUF983 family)
MGTDQHRYVARPVSQPKVSFGSLVKRGLARRCPICRHKPIFDSWFRLKDRCPNCSYEFAREEGYWVSAIIVNTAVIEGLFLLIFIAVVIATAPDVEWGPLLLVAVVTNVLFPIFFYPYSKTVWMAVDLHFHPLDENERATLTTGGS